MANPKINTHLLNILIRKEHRFIAEFARVSDIPVQQIYNWVSGVCSPPPERVELMAKHLNVSPQIFYIPGLQFVRMGIDSALTRWSVEQQHLTAPTLTSNEALQFVRFTEPNIMEETDGETKEEEFTVQGPSELSDATEPSGYEPVSVTG